MKNVGKNVRVKKGYKSISQERIFGRIKSKNHNLFFKEREVIQIMVSQQRHYMIMNKNH